MGRIIDLGLAMRLNVSLEPENRKSLLEGLVDKKVSNINIQRLSNSPFFGLTEDFDYLG